MPAHNFLSITRPLKMVIIVTKLPFSKKCPLFGGRPKRPENCIFKKSVTFFLSKKNVCEHVSHKHFFAFVFKSLRRYSQNGHLLGSLVLRGKL